LPQWLPRNNCLAKCAAGSKLSARDTSINPGAFAMRDPISAGQQA
jgi:hypothetical protein